MSGPGSVSRNTIRLLCAFVCVLAVAQLAHAQPGASTKPSPDERVWNLTPYLKGNAAQVRDLMNGELERLLVKQKATTRLIAGYREKIKAEEQAAAAAIQKDPQYIKLREEMQKAEADMAAVQASGSRQERMDASSRFNKVRGQVEKLDRTATAGEAVAPLRKLLAEQEADLRRCDDSIAKAQKWRTELLDATRNSFRLMWPLDAGEVGMLGTITPLKIVSPDSVLIDYDALEILRKAGDAEGVTTVNVRSHKVSMLVSGVDAAAMRAGLPVTPDMTFAVVKDAAGDRPCEVKRQPTDADRLMEVIVPLRVEGAADVAAGATGRAGPSSEKGQAQDLARRAGGPRGGARRPHPKKGQPWTEPILQRMNDWLGGEVAGDTLETPAVFASAGPVKDGYFELRGEIEVPSGPTGVKPHSITARCPATLAAKAAAMKAGQKIRVTGTIAAMRAMADDTTAVELVEAAF